MLLATVVHIVTDAVVIIVVLIVSVAVIATLLCLNGAGSRVRQQLAAGGRVFLWRRVGGGGHAVLVLRAVEHGDSRTARGWQDRRQEGGRVCGQARTTMLCCACVSVFRAASIGGAYLLLIAIEGAAAVDGAVTYGRRQAAES